MSACRPVQLAAVLADLGGHRDFGDPVDLALQRSHGRDGYHLLEAVRAPGALADLPAVAALRCA